MKNTTTKRSSTVPKKNLPQDGKTFIKNDLIADIKDQTGTQKASRIPLSVGGGNHDEEEEEEDELRRQDKGNLAKLSPQELKEFEVDIIDFYGHLKNRYDESVKLKPPERTRPQGIMLAFKPKSEHKHESFDFQPICDRVKKKFGYKTEEFDQIEITDLQMLEQISRFKLFCAFWEGELKFELQNKAVCSIETFFTEVSTTYKSFNRSRLVGHELLDNSIVIDRTNNVITLIFGIDEADVFYFLISFDLASQKGNPKSMNDFESKYGALPKNMNYLFDDAHAAKGVLSAFLKLKVTYLCSFYYCCGCNYNY